MTGSDQLVTEWCFRSAAFMFPVKLVLLCILGAISTHGAWAHGGGLNAEGCHNNRKTGDYHCHGGVPSRSITSPLGVSPSGNSFSRGVQSGAWSYANCTEARAAGAAPIRRGEPGYGPHLDRDNDGIACEPYRGGRK